VLSSKSLNIVEDRKVELLRELRNEAIGLVEAFRYDDNTLASAIGRQDGRAYETLFDWAKNYNRVNKPEWMEGKGEVFIALQEKHRNLPKL
jgi:hypothetical protein